MLQILNLITLLALSAAVLFLWYDRRKTRAAIEEAERGDVVTQAELDSYHHRVVHLYQTQRDWCRGKFEETDYRIRSLENSPERGRTQSSPSNPAAVSSNEPESKPLNSFPENGPTVEPPEENFAPAPSPEPEPLGESEPSSASFDSAEEKVWKAWESGRSIDQIAQELRMGRQEVQLLIQVSRHRPAGQVGV